MINWDISKEDHAQIVKVVLRAMAQDPSFNTLDLTMDMTACHLNGCALDFQKLLGFDDFNFMHDIYGISKNIDRTTGKVENCFAPRSALR